MADKTGRLHEGQSVVSLPSFAAGILNPQTQGISPKTSENLLAFSAEL